MIDRIAEIDSIYSVLIELIYYFSSILKPVLSFLVEGVLLEIQHNCLSFKLGLVLLSAPVKFFLYLPLRLNSACPRGPSKYVSDAKLNMRMILDIQFVIIV
jgi:hypothetical protein